jgi:pimeloyl-ACP methyl ester carboxylesterase
MDILRTPEARFDSIPGFPFAPRYVEDLPGYAGLRMHHVDEGPRDRRVFLCLHGEPTWSYLYRRMIPVLTAAGHRAVAPDFFGFGRSDKPADEAVYTFGWHRGALVRFVERLDLRDVVLVVQDWGGLLGLTLPMELPDRVRGLLVLNTALATGEAPPSQGFLAWRAHVRSHPDLDVARLMQRACPHLTDGEAAAYAAPFPDARFKAGVRRFPELAPVSPEMDGAETSRRAAEFLRTRWSGASLMAIGMRDPVLGPAVMRHLRGVIRGCPEPLEIPDAGHFVPEWGEEIARRAVEAFG